MSQSDSAPSTKPFSYHEMKDLFDEILNKCGKSKDDVKHAIGTIGISMKDITTSDGLNNGIFESESSSSSKKI